MPLSIVSSVSGNLAKGNSAFANAPLMGKLVKFVVDIGPLVKPALPKRFGFVYAISWGMNPVIVVGLPTRLENTAQSHLHRGGGRGLWRKIRVV